jgi:hypothetical protein
MQMSLPVYRRAREYLKGATPAFPSDLQTETAETSVFVSTGVAMSDSQLRKVLVSGKNIPRVITIASGRMF